MCDRVVTLQIPGEKLSPNNVTGVYIDEPSILVKSSTEGSQTWSMDKLNCRLDDMVDIYDQVTSEDIDNSEIGKSLPDPFYDSIENHVLIGVANIFLTPLFHDVKFSYNTPIVAQDGTVSGKLMIELVRTSGHMEAEQEKEDESSSVSSSSEDLSESEQELRFRLRLVSVSGLPPSLAHFVFSQFSFFNSGTQK